MSSVTHEEIRLRILELLYETAKEEITRWGVGRDAIENALNISEKDMDANMLYLAQRNMVRLTQTNSVLWYLAHITPFGVAVLENRQQYARQFPFLKVSK